MILRWKSRNSAYTDPLMPDDLENIADHEAFTMVLASLVSIASFKMFEAIAKSNQRFQIEFDLMERSYSSESNSIVTEYESTHRDLFVT